LNIARASTPINSAKQDLTQQVNQRVSNLLALAEERIRDGSLIEPAQDNARFYIESAAGIAPDNAQVRAAERDLASRLLVRGQSTLAAGNSEEGERWLAAAADAGAAPDDITSIRRDIARTRINAKADTMARLSQLFNQRLNQGRLMEPSDSARFYLMQLEQSDASHPSTRLARVSLSGRLLEEARQATGRGDLVAAQSFVSDARKLGANSVNAASVERAIAAARDKTPRLDRSEDGLISAGRLERLRYVPPDYPMEARQKGLSGNVELVFTVRADGRVTDVSVQSAIPARIFDDAAIEAVRKWRYRPYERDGRPVDQRVKLNLRFAME
jgi:protein TonB